MIGKFRNLIGGFVGKIREYEQINGRLAGASTDQRKTALAWQVVDALRRVEFVRQLSRKDISPNRKDPSSPQFDPIRAAVLYRHEGNVEEAYWLIFLSTHFGKNLRHGWSTTREVYSGGNSQAPWTFQRIQANVDSFIRWLAANEGGIELHPGNHRKYVSLSATKPHATGQTIRSYLAWSAQTGAQARTVEHIWDLDGSLTQQERFASLYQSLRSVDGFGRTARFDLLCMLAKVGLIDIEPDQAYLSEATGPLSGAALLFRGDKRNTGQRKELDLLLCELGRHLDVGPNIMEDAVCNWQKDPQIYVPFRG
jgi:hypothetical protein